MEIKEIVFVTGNERKLSRARDILGKYDIEVKQVDMETKFLDVYIQEYQ